ncbi:MAG TPA: hypothetical protein VEZ72_19965 [Paenibacillus sp.]|nr:hypothetical protein [Paenibacillus sp.]
MTMNSSPHSSRGCTRARLDPSLERFAKSIEIDSLGGVEPRISMDRVEDAVTRASIRFRLDRPVACDDWKARVAPAFLPTLHWAPHLTPTDRHVVDRHCFRSPALLAADGRRSVAIVPDLDVLARQAGTPWYLDLDAANGELIVGMSRTEPDESAHVLFVKRPGAVYEEGEVEVAFYILTLERPDGEINPWRPILSFLWKRWGASAFRTIATGGTGMETMVGRAYRWAFRSWESAVWQHFELDGEPVGASVFIVNVTQSPNFPGPVDEREFRSIWNQAWFSSLRTAHGMYRYGKATGDEDLVRRALRTKRLALAAPKRDGFFPAVLATEMERVALKDGTLANRSKGWGTAYWGNSNRNPVAPWGGVRDAPYHTLDMSWTALWMLRWHEELEPDEALLGYAAGYADALLRLQREDGFFPAWLDSETLRPLDVLADSPESSASATFLFKLAELTEEKRYAEAALRAIDAVARDVVPQGRWEDFETYWSCSSFGGDRVGRKFERNDMYKQCNFSMFWTAEACKEAFAATDEERYLRIGERCLDELLMTQASWQPPYVPIDAVGGFGVMNGDAEWNDARQSLFAELIVDYGELLEREEYIERGMAALRAAFVMMYCPENPKTKAQWEAKHPFFGEEDYGFMMENYGHNGRVGERGLGIGEFAIFDWGAGAAAEAYLRMKAHRPELLRRYGW